MREKANEEKQNRKQNRKKKQSPRELSAEEVTESIVLDYGDAPEAEATEVDTSDAIESQLRQDAEVAAKSDLPPLPEDIDSLPALTPADIKAGAIVVFKMFTMVGAAPAISGFVTAIVEDEGDSGNGAGTIGLRLAERDREQREVKFDRKGERIYNRADNFQLASDEENEGDDGRRDLVFPELMEAKLLQGAASAA